VITMNNKIISYSLSLLLMYSGVATIIDPYVPTSSFFGFDTIPRGGDVGSIKWALGILLFCLGALLFYSEYRKK
jgi:hypothetical protein